jgi:hypothetical protein
VKQGFELITMGVPMRLLAVVPSGIVLTLVLLAVGEETAMGLRDSGVRVPYFEAAVLFPLVTLIVGSLVGLLARNKALLAAVLVFAPCAVSVLLPATTLAVFKSAQHFLEILRTLHKRPLERP